MVGAEMTSAPLAVYLAFSCRKTARCGVGFLSENTSASTEAVTNMRGSRMGGKKIRAHLLFLLANGEAFLMNSAASEEDESGMNMHEL